MTVWQLQDAKARLSELVRQASTEGPQAITVRGQDEAVVLSIEEYQKLVGESPSFIAFVRSSPMKGIDLMIKRDRSAARNIKL